MLKYSSFPSLTLSIRGLDNGGSYINQSFKGFAYWDEHAIGRTQLDDTLISFGEKIIPHLKKMVEDKTEDMRRRHVASALLLRIDKNYIDLLSNT